MGRLLPHPDHRITPTERIGAGLTAALGLIALATYAIDSAGFGVQPWAALGAGVAIAAGVTIAIPGRRGDSRDLAVWVGVVAFVLAMLARLSWPALMPPGRGPDLTHHLLLVDYIEQSGHLPHDRALDGSMGEMAHYTPAAHLLAVVAGRWTGADGLHAFFPLVALCAALTAGFVYLIARRLQLAMPFALSAVTLLFLPAQYFFGAFTHDSFLAQTVATLFAVASWWALTLWMDVESTAVAAIFGIFVAATYLSWPVFLGPAVAVFGAMIVRADGPWRERLRALAVGLAPLLALFLLHSWNRWGWMMIVRTSGAVLHPSLDSLGWLLPVLAAIGAIAAFADRRARVSVILLFVIALQALTLFIIATAQGATTPYMALKMFYLAIYPMALLAALAIARLASASPISGNLGWLIAAVLLLVARPALSTPRQIAVVDNDLYQAGKWIRANGSAACVDYLVADAETAYWLHLAVLGNPRSSARMNEIDRYDPRSAVAPWITAEGRNYAIADMRILPNEVRSRVDVTTQFGHAAVITPRNATMKGCD